MGRIPFIAALLFAGLFAFAPQPRAQTAEDLVKATFLYRFTSFVTWPPGVFADEQAPVRLCVVGADAFAVTLARAVDGQRVGTRSFAVQRLTNVSAATQCQVLYVVGDRVDDALRAVRGSPVLTVTDGSVGGATRGMIHFVVISDRIRFHIDDARAAESQLAVDSRLLSLAVSVRRRAAA